MTVYVVQEMPGKNITGAIKYGEMKALVEPNSQIMLSPAPTVRKMKNKLKNFSDDDYLLLMGDPAAIGIACALAADSNRGRLKLLKWDKQNKGYYPIQVDLYDKGDTLDENLY
jgi:hypothetical protein